MHLTERFNDDLRCVGYEQRACDKLGVEDKPISAPGRGSVNGGHFVLKTSSMVHVKKIRRQQNKAVKERELVRG